MNADLENTDLDRLLPHRPPMQLLSRVLRADATSCWAEVDIHPGSRFLRNGEVPALVGLEYLAQTAAAYFALHSPAGAGAPRPGKLIACRQFRSRCTGFATNTCLLLGVHLVAGNPDTAGAPGLIKFRGEITETEKTSDDAGRMPGHPGTAMPLVVAELSVYL
ncbi:MAG: hypothetical protein H6993_10750 [Pseudomonadales bacterium]|nr:hypothetical protein [Pseudomonadales bacterium]MCP5184434.1 hypothetical protein [Pseudomonadales bacterium]